MKLFTTRQKVNLYFSIFIGIIGSFVSILMPKMLSKLIDLESSTVPLNVIAALIGIVLLQIILGAISNLMTVKNVESVLVGFISRVQGHLLRVKESELHQFNSTEISSLIMTNADIIKTFYSVSLVEVLTSIFVVVPTLVLLILIDWKLTLLIFIFLPVWIIILSPLSARVEKLSQETNQVKSFTISKMAESFLQRKSIKVNNAETFASEQVLNNLDKLKQQAIKEKFMDSITRLLAITLLIAVIAAIFYYGSQRVLTGSITMGEFISFLIYIFMLLTPMSAISQFGNQVGKYKAAMQYFDELNQLVEEEKGGEFVSLRGGDIRIEDLSFKYHEDENNVFENLSLSIQANQLTALVGPSGAGKSTLIQLILRLYEPTDGAIIYNGQLSESVSIKSLREQIAWLSQDNVLLNASIRENLIYSLAAVPDELQLWNVLEQVDLKEMVENLPNQLDSEVGEMGSNLSGGQKQRLQFARALLEKAPVIILDEATAHLDSQSEKIIVNIIEEMRKETTFFVISHRLSTTQTADKIYFLDKGGKITGEGTHYELMNNHSTYAKFVENQMINS
ncbi:ABC transporter ATP-binding protein [Aerococcaceae bacterium zg-ZUI334]|uniref:ABC transporter ATP-binding protein n=1 Tax=Aerococcaceae bacterium zg-252 TaxID=2796928 RepID=UPI001B8DD040|nr:ABC transporter ATP-binding protein [Aerococcaceae bacterium zg-ZUI334]